MKKNFFKTRTRKQIENLHFSAVYNKNNLVERIENLNLNEEAVIIRTKIIPDKFYTGGLTGKQAGKKCLKHGETMHLDYPPTKTSSCFSHVIPLKIRAEKLSKLKSMPQESINFVGLSSRPNFGDRTKRVQHFFISPEGIKLFGYSENYAEGIKVKEYADSKKARREGASVVVEVPSRTMKNPRYRFKLLHVPIVRNNFNLVAVQLLKPALIMDEETREPIKGRTPYDDYLIRYTYEDESESSNIVFYQPQDVAAYLSIIKKQLREHNLTPLEMNPFMLTSKHGAEYYKKLENNVLIFDPSINQSKENPCQNRKLNLAEKCILFARGIGKFGHDDFAYWDGTRDKKLADYDWGV